MKGLVIFAALSGFFSPAYAQLKIMPNEYAEQYCMLRRNGVSGKEAMATAIRGSSVNGYAATVTIDGQEIGIDVLAAVEATHNLCPHLMRP